MASSSGKVELYFAETFKDLQKKAEEKWIYLDKANAHLSFIHADKLWTQFGKSWSQGDEELAYFSLYKCVVAITSAKLKMDYPKYKAVYTHLLFDQVFKMNLKTLRNNLERRYAARTKGREEVMKQYPGAVAITSTASVKSAALKICEVKVKKLPLNLSHFVESKQSSLSSLPRKLGVVSNPDQLSKVTVKNIDPQPVDGSEETVKFCRILKQKIMDEDWGASALSISFEVKSFNKESKLVGMAIRVDGPFIKNLVEGCDMKLNQSLKMTVSMRLYGKDFDLCFQDTHMKLFEKKGETPFYFEIYVGLIALDEWSDDISQPEAKITLQLVGNVDIEPAATCEPLPSTSSVFGWVFPDMESAILY